MTHPQARILVVGSADHCRAPLIAAVLRDLLAGLQVAVPSAGTAIGESLTVCSTARGRLPAAALDGADAERAVQVVPSAVDDADLVITVDRAQRAAVNRLAPGRQWKVFTLAEAAALATGTPRRREAPALEADSLSGFAEQLHERRGSVDPLPFDVPRRGLLHRPIVECDPDDVPDAHVASAAAHAWSLDRAEHLARLLGAATASAVGRRVVAAS